MCEIERVGQHVEFRHVDGRCQMVRATAIQMLGDYGECQTEAFLVVAGRTVIVPASYDVLRNVIADASCPPPRP